MTMNRWATGWFSLFVSLLTTSLNAENSKPNVLILLADNWAAPHASIMGDRSVKTPTFDSIARNGVYFTNAFCQIPSCSPSRAVLLTGRVAHQLEDAANLWGQFPDQQWTFPLALSRSSASYQVGYMIKGWGPGRYLGERHTFGKPNPAGFKTESFEAFLETVGDKPFCFWFGSHDPHRPWEAEKEFYRGLDASKVEVPSYLPDHPTVRKEIVDYYAEVQKFDSQCGEIIESLKRVGKYENTIILMLGDNGWQMPRGLANIYDWGTHVPFAIQWPKEIQSGLKADTFVSFEDVGPTLFELIGMDGSEMVGKSFVGVLQGATVEHRDSVFLERERHANVRADDASYPCRAIRTKDFLWIWNIRPELHPAGDPETHWAVGPFGDIDNSLTKSLLLESDLAPHLQQWRDLAVAKRPEFELYDLRIDPWQINNISGHPDYARHERQLKSEVARWMRRTRDPRAANLKTNIFDRYEYFGRAAKQLTN